ncbi:alanine--glyoxylate aminotransferase family protein, partial [Shewanella sp.]|uniref:pyridoxal-phosphate-dependent aminotransferase family protein n=1 Tax=Shewanella sp. TaxID=50422 RepID=UPI0025873E6C
MNNYLLFTPGPVNVAESVRQAVAKEDICHREVEFDQLLQSIETKLLKIFELKQADYRAVVITGSGTAANESMLSSVVGDKNILIITNGEFGERLVDISTIHNKNTCRLDFPWGEVFDMDKISDYLKCNNVDVIAMVHHETSSGMLNPIEKVGALAKKHNALFIVDGVSSAGAEKIDMKKCHIDFFSSSSSKAIGSYCGLSFILGKVAEFEKLKQLPVKTMYLNLYKFYYFIKTFSQTPNTPAVHLFFALEQALINFLDEGVVNRYATLKNRAKRLRQGMAKLGLKFLIAEKNMCSVLTTVHIPKHIDVGDFRQKLREKSIIIYEGKGCFKNKVFQVGNIGELSDVDLQYFLSSLSNVLASFKMTEKSDIQLNPAAIIGVNSLVEQLSPTQLSIA